MYSYEERRKAVELYIKYDKRACAVIRELEYPFCYRALVVKVKHVKCLKDRL